MSSRPVHYVSIRKGGITVEIRVAAFETWREQAAELFEEAAETMRSGLQGEGLVHHVDHPGRGSS